MNQAAKLFLVILLLALAMGRQAAWAQEDGTTAEETQARPGLQEPPPGEVDPKRFGKVPDLAFGAFQRGHYLTALNLARPRAEAGNSAAQTLMAEIYARGLGVARNAEEAAKWYGRAAEQGDPEAQMQYALMLIDGRFVEEDREKAYTLMRSAAEAGKPLAQFNLAQMMTEEGASMEEAVGWYERAAKTGLPDAQYAMAQVHAHGIGGKPEDAAAARRWLLRAARQNYDTAQLDLGTWLVEGRGGEAKPEDGFAWLKRAADGGNVAAQNRVAKLYRAGVGVEADPVEAAAWYILARRAGLTDREMEDFMDGLTNEQLKAALERANRLR
ncbi:tetratricopeptide repeat protein [Chelativorans xinjiangense]|uniref:tetratricopeptide repeat protein n=1 Tax=Chelativorans xinjiangense TaxID=2681485 RepID=UPI0013584686|nr:tetratricopeptide repeat protein [Chelativorans xinjiangense]